MKNIHLCTSWLKWCYLYLKLFLKFSSTWRIYTSVRVFFNYFYGRISTSMWVDYNGISTLETVFTTRIYTSVWVFFNFSLKNIYLCMSWKQYLPEEYTPMYEWFIIFFLIKKISPCTSWLQLHMFSTRRLYTTARVDYNGISTLETVFTTRIYSSVWVFLNFSLKNIYPCASLLKLCFLH